MSSLDYLSDPGGGNPSEQIFKQSLSSALDSLQQQQQPSDDDILSTDDLTIELPNTDDLIFQALTGNHSSIADTVSLLCQNLTNNSDDNSSSFLNCNPAAVPDFNNSSSSNNNLTSAISPHRLRPPATEHTVDYFKVYVLSTMTILTIVGNASVVLSILLRRYVQSIGTRDCI